MTRALVCLFLLACGPAQDAKQPTCQDLTFRFVDDPTTMQRATYASPVKTADEQLCEKR